MSLGTLYNVFLLQLNEQLHANHVSPMRKAHALHVTQRSSVEDDTCFTTDENTTHHRHSNSADEGIAEIDGPTSVPVLLEMLREKDDRIQVLGDNLLRVSTSIQFLLLVSILIKVIKISFFRDSGNFDQN